MKIIKSKSYDNQVEYFFTWVAAKIYISWFFMSNIFTQY